MNAAHAYGLMHMARIHYYNRAKRDPGFRKKLRRWKPDPEPPDYNARRLRHKVIAAAQKELGLKFRWRDSWRTGNACEKYSRS